MAMNYRSKKYALLNTPIEVERHLGRVQHFLQPAATDQLLEIGCGRGFLTRRVQAIAPLTRGIDLNPEAIANGTTQHLEVMDAEHLAFADESFDKIYSFHAIEHIPDLAAAFREIDRVLRPGGSALLVYPAEPIRGLYVVPTAMILFGNPWRAREIHIHKLTPRRLRPYLAGTELQVARSRLDLFITPQFMTLLTKGEPARVRPSRRAISSPMSRRRRAMAEIV
jgi:ubiquinone/menaquinone biosynthesis C-methylase UbiE